MNLNNHNLSPVKMLDLAIRAIVFNFTKNVFTIQLSLTQNQGWQTTEELIND